ncbi:MAG: ABC transporter permease subunit [Candidatus Devosia symbiotica]|nr:ABC transporter permease subunit [Candidatus Devosia symbiotica]
MNAPGQQTLNQRAGLDNLPVSDFVGQTWESGQAPSTCPHQVIGEIWKAAIGTDINSKHSPAYHAGITLSSILLGFALGTLLGVGLALVIVHNDASDRSLVPWIITSQTVSILAIAPMVVGLGGVGVTGLLPKALISMYLSFFPVVVGMLKGLRTSEAIQLNLMWTYNASPWQVFSKLRWPSAVPFLFASIKVDIAISLIGAVVSELSNNAGGDWACACSLAPVTARSSRSRRRCWSSPSVAPKSLSTARWGSRVNASLNTPMNAPDEPVVDRSGCCVDRRLRHHPANGQCPCHLPVVCRGQNADPAVDFAGLSNRIGFLLAGSAGLLELCLVVCRASVSGYTCARYRAASSAW